MTGGPTGAGAGCHLAAMQSVISAKGQLALPAEIRRQDGIKPGQTFEIERIESG